MRNNFVFDLDNTLFREIEWVKSALKHCAQLVGEKFGLDREEVFTVFMEGYYERGRGKVFRLALKKLGLQNDEIEKIFPYLYYRYRTHKPRLTLSPEVKSTLVEMRNRGCKLGVITDGILSAQINKYQALGLEKLVDSVVYTEVMGYDKRKPNPLPFQVMKIELGEEGIFYYIGDNPEKDFIGAREAGYRTIMLQDNCNHARAEELPDEYKADLEITSIRDLLCIP